MEKNTPEYQNQFSFVIQTYKSNIWYTAKRYLPDRTLLVEECVQLTYQNIYNNLARVLEAENIKSYIITIAYHAATHIWEKHHLEDLDEQIEALLDQSFDIDQITNILAVAQEVEKLPENYRRVVQLKESGYSHKEIAESLGITENNSRQRYYYALEQIRKELKGDETNGNS